MKRYLEIYCITSLCTESSNDSYFSYTFSCYPIAIEVSLNGLYCDLCQRISTWTGFIGHYSQISFIYEITRFNGPKKSLEPLIFLHPLLHAIKKALGDASHLCIDTCLKRPSASIFFSLYNQKVSW